MENCDLIYLTDENLCLSKSFEIFNTNFQELSSNIKILETYNTSFLNLYTNFTANSGKWLNAITNIGYLSAKLNSAFATVNSLSSIWIQDFEITYPSLINYSLWYNNFNNYKNTILRTWLNVNFPPNEYSLNQTIILNINIFHQVGFNFTVNKSYYENCYVYSSATACCGGCGISYKKCNWEDKKGKKSHIDGCNLCNNCGVRVDTSCRSVTCSSLSGAKNLFLFGFYRNLGIIK